MRASDMDDEDRSLAASPPGGDGLPSDGYWWLIVGAAIAIVLICALWTVWN